MKTFKQFLIEQDVPGLPGFEWVDEQGRPMKPPVKKPSKTVSPNTEIKPGAYETTAKESLIKRLGSEKKANEYIEQIRQRRQQFPNDVDKDLILPSVDEKDLNQKVSVSIIKGKHPDPKQASSIGMTNTIRRVDLKDPNLIIKAAESDKGSPDISIYTNPDIGPRSSEEEATHVKNLINADVARASSELQKNGKYIKNTDPLSDVLWHELQHVMQRPNLIGKSSKDNPFKSSIDYSTNDLSIPSSMSKYTTSTMELPAHASESKMRFYQDTGTLLGANMSKNDLDKYKEWLNLDQSKQSKIILQLLKDPNKSKQTEELLRQIAKNNNDQSDTMMA